MIHIDHNGSKFAGDAPEPLDHLLDLLAREPLSPLFERYGDGDVETAAMGDLGPIHPEAPDARRFWGNFYAVSNGFCVDTDEPETIERLQAAIRANKASTAYREARAEWLAAEDADRVRLAKRAW